MHTSTPRISRPTPWVVRALLALALLPAVPALAQDGPPGTETDRQRPPALEQDAEEIKLDGKYTIRQLVEYFADLMNHNYILPGGERELAEEVSIISHEGVSRWTAYQAFLAALEASGYVIVDVGGAKQIVKSDSAAQEPIGVHTGGDIPRTAAYVTQIIPLRNVQVADVNQVVTTLASANAKVIAYQPANTLIITDTAHNLRRIYQVLEELDVSAPRSRLEVIQIRFADATEVATLIEELYAVGEAAEEPEPEPRSRRARRRRRRRREAEEESTDSVTAGGEATFIKKILADERTNTLMVLANDEGFEAIYDLLEDIDIDVDLTSRSQIHVVYLQHAKSEEVATVLANLSEGGTGGTEPRGGAAARRARAEEGEQAEGEEPIAGAIAAFDSGMRITSDESTNSLVIIASPEDFAVVERVIQQLDVRRRQVFVDAVILELSSDNSSEIGVAYHGPFDPPGEGGLGFLGAQLGTQSLGLTQDLLSGLAVGVFGEAIEVPFSTAQGTSILEVPAFGIVLSALRSNSLVNIVSNPNLLTLDNEEASIIVGRKVPFPTSSGFSQLGTPIVSFQREDVATELRITPRVNSSNEVTLEIVVLVSEIEEDSQGLDIAQTGPVTSKREIETVALVRDNQTVVLGGLVGTTDTEVETKVPILGDLPLIGVLFRGQRTESRKSNLMVFLTPHIIDGEADMQEVMRIKEAQRQEFIRRFYGKSQDQQIEEMQELLEYSMNLVDRPSVYRGPIDVEDAAIEGEPVSDDTREVLLEELERTRTEEPGEGAGELEEEEEPPVIVLPEDADLAVPVGEEE